MSLNEYGLRVLVAGSDPSRATALCQRLSAEQATAVASMTVSDAVVRLLSGNFDIVVLDTDIAGDYREVSEAAVVAGTCPSVIILAGPEQDVGLAGISALPRDVDEDSLVSEVERIAGSRANRATQPVLNALQRTPTPTPDPDPVTSLSFAPSTPDPGLARAPDNPQTEPDLPLVARIEARDRTPFPRLPATPTLTTGLPFVGDVSETSVSALLYKIFSNRQTGELNIHTRSNDRTIYFRNGEPVWATSRSSDELLGAIAVKMGLISLADLESVLEGDANTPLGERLVAAGCLSEDELEAALDQQVYERILGCFAIKTGPFLFRESDDWHGEVEIRQNPIELIFVGIERHVGPGQIAAEIAHHTDRFVVRTRKFHHFLPFVADLENDKPALALLDGNHTTKAIIDATGQDAQLTMRWIYSLRQASMIEFSDKPRTDVPASTGQSSSATPTVRPMRPVRRPRLGGVKPGERPVQDLPLGQRVRKFHQRLSNGKNHQILDVSEGASRDELRVAFRRAIDAVPPEEVSSLPPDEQRMANEFIEAVKSAYDELAGGGGKRLRPRQAGRPPRRPANLAARRNNDANLAAVYLKRARLAAVQNNWPSAAQWVGRAESLEPESPEVLALAGWVWFHQPGDLAERAEQANTRLKKAVALDASHVDAHLFLARIAEKSGDNARAFFHYRDVVELAPDNSEAKAALPRLREDAPLPDRAEDGSLESLQSWLKD